MAMIEATVETFSDLSGVGEVLVDVGGPQCQPCLALMPAVEALEATYGDRVRFLTVNAPDNRAVCRDLHRRRVAGLSDAARRRRGRATHEQRHHARADRTGDHPAARRRTRRRPAVPRTPTHRGEVNHPWSYTARRSSRSASATACPARRSRRSREAPAPRSSRYAPSASSERRPARWTRRTKP